MVDKAIKIKVSGNTPPRSPAIGARYQLPVNSKINVRINVNRRDIRILDLLDSFSNSFIKDFPSRIFL